MEICLTQTHVFFFGIIRDMIIYVQKQAGPFETRQVRWGNKVDYVPIETRPLKMKRDSHIFHSIFLFFDNQRTFTFRRVCFFFGTPNAKIIGFPNQMTTHLTCKGFIASLLDLLDAYTVETLVANGPLNNTAKKGVWLCVLS